LEKNVISIFRVENQPSKKAARADVPADSLFYLATCSLWFLARLIFDPEDGGDTFLRSVGSYTDYTALYLRRWQFSTIEMIS
jgi:hypothetical protein